MGDLRHDAPALQLGQLVRHLPLAVAFAAFIAITSAAAQPRAALLRIHNFPTIDAPEIPSSTLDEALAGLPFEVVSSLDDLTRFTTLILPYGSSFPLDEWLNIRAFIARGGNLVVLGGAPFHQPVLQGNVLGVRQPTWAHELLIGPAERIAVPADASVVTPQPFWKTPIVGARNTYALTLRLARETSMRGEHGSEGPREAVVRPLVHVVHKALPRATPLIEIDRLRGPGPVDDGSSPLRTRRGPTAFVRSFGARCAGRRTSKRAPFTPPRRR